VTEQLNSTLYLIKLLIVTRVM